MGVGGGVGGGWSSCSNVFDLCNQIWSGPSATESMSNGLDGAVDLTDAQYHQPYKQLVTMIGQMNLIKKKILNAV